MVGYNRRFSPLSEALKQRVGDGRFRGHLQDQRGSGPADSWIQDREIGGGRILGEVCHFIDYLIFLCGSSPASVQAFAMDDPHGHQDTLTVSIRFLERFGRQHQLFCKRVEGASQGVRGSARPRSLSRVAGFQGVDCLRKSQALQKEAAGPGQRTEAGGPPFPGSGSKSCGATHSC